MSDDEKPPLSPQEQQQNEDASKIQTEFGVTDTVERAASQLDKFGFGNFGGFFARTSFEERELNDMLDLLDGANPTDLSNAGLNLAKAKESLNAAAEELSKFVKGTVWRGAAATEFERYGTALAGYAWDLGSFANVVGTQMTVAATGLTSVRSAKPPRDTRADRRRPKDFPVTEQKDDNPEYKRAVQVEENRQEGINQMNRLASFYAVSEQSLAGVKEPELPKMLGTAVPPPKWGDWEKSPDSGGSGGTDRLDSSPTRSSAVRPDAGGTEGIARTSTDGLVAEKPLPNTSMEIDSVKTLPSTPTSPGPTQPIPVTGGPPVTNAHVPPLGPNLGLPVRGGGPRSGPPLAPRGGGPGPVSNARTSTGGGGRPGPVGRPTPMNGGTTSGSQSGRGPVGRPTTPMGPGTGRGGTNATRSPMVGRPSTGGQSMGGRSGSGSSSGPRTGGRNNGIVGGTPQRSPGGSKGNSGSRIPRGNVIGAQGQGTTPGRPTSAARPSQSGVVGNKPAQGATRPTGRGMPSSNGVVGTPRNGGTPPRGGGFTPGGSGLTGGRRGRESDDDEQERPGQRRPESRADDEETRTVRRRDAVPPVID
ncbi:hypothetical protein OG275_28360 [Streptomyces niveus]|uniref:hypothetical protein n=1 Tax=Streptomyces niveus TaxID=193462 RepID=UPI002E35EAC8|nr:hypothetical protein [Streptomyces niveus]